MTEVIHDLRHHVDQFRSTVLRVRKGDLSFAALAVAIVFGSLLGIVVLQTLIVQTRVELDQVNAELDGAIDENQELRLAMLELEAPARVQNVALTRLGMIRPITRKYLPGIDPATVPVAPPQVENPFGPGPLPPELLPPESAPVEPEQ